VISGVAVVDRRVLAIDEASLLQALEEHRDVQLGIAGGLSAKMSDHRLSQLLRPGRQRPRRRPAKPRDEFPP
jgi:hypothetical protein